MAQIEWIKFHIKTFDGLSFKRIRKAKIDGVIDFRDKLTAVWFELMIIAGKINNDGLLIDTNGEFKTLEDIAIMIDRTEKEISICIEWFVKNEMIEITQNGYKLMNWEKYQTITKNADYMLANRERQKRFRDKKRLENIESNASANVTVTLRNGQEEEKEEEKEKDIIIIEKLKETKLIEKSIGLSILENQSELKNILEKMRGFNSDEFINVFNKYENNEKLIKALKYCIKRFQREGENDITPHIRLSSMLDYYLKTYI